jgi:predicted nucleic acid-binding protein
MKRFFDTSVLIAAFWSKHPAHVASLELFASTRKEDSACGIHTLAEVFAVITALPARPRMLPEQAILLVEQVRQHLTIIPLDESEYYDTILTVGARGVAGARVYDALLLRCAAKWEAEVIYTWNVKHFVALAPELAHLVCTPTSRSNA